MGNPLCAVLVWVWLIVCFFIYLCGSLCVTWLLPVGNGERKCENSLGDSSIVGICVSYYGRIMWMFCTSGAPVYLVYLLVGVCLALVVLRVVFTYVYF